MVRKITEIDWSDKDAVHIYLESFSLEGEDLDVFATRENGKNILEQAVSTGDLEVLAQIFSYTSLEELEKYMDSYGDDKASFYENLLSNTGLLHSKMRVFLSLVIPDMEKSADHLDDSYAIAEKVHEGVLVIMKTGGELERCFEYNKVNNPIISSYLVGSSYKRYVDSTLDSDLESVSSVEVESHAARIEAERSGPGGESGGSFGGPGGPPRR